MSEQTEAAQETAEAVEPGGGGRMSPLRRAFRSRTARTAVVAGLVGALLGAGAVAWRTDTLPLVDGAAPCWDSLGEGTVTALFGEDREVRSEEQRLGGSSGLRNGICRVTSFQDGRPRRAVDIRVHELDGLYGADGDRWPADYLDPDMVSLGKGLPGMVSGARAWIALPEKCTGKPGDFEAATVVDVSLGRAGVDYEPGLRGWEEDRAALARAAVDAANGAIRALGCSQSYAAPGALAKAGDWEEADQDALCGTKGFALPAGFSRERREALTRERFGGFGGPARSCEVGGPAPNTYLRFTTVETPSLTAIFNKAVLHGGTRVEGPRGYGSLSETRAAYKAKCPKGSVVFLVEQKRAIDDVAFDLTRSLLPAYVAAEAERIGCGPEKVRIMRG
ncbi:hypothetical protein ACH4TP_16360 [Streptomyces sp. NPDC021012]|uniref:hypothetical protein n=1 Tax=Streptomyces sp. NPDC021012 TaxID=3365107 RepID=UPI003791C768